MYTIVITYKDGTTFTITQVKAIHLHSQGAIDCFRRGEDTPFFPGVEENVHEMRIFKNR